VQCRQTPHGRFTWSLVSQGARYPSGKGEVCKTFMRRFDPDPRLQVNPVLAASFEAFNTLGPVTTIGALATGANLFEFQE